MKRYFPFQALLSVLILLGLVIFLSISSFAQTPGAETCGTVATTITPSASCTNVTYNIKDAVSEGVAGSCTGASTTYDRWFRFATSPTATAVTITLSVGGGGSSLSPTTTYVEVFNGSCGSLTTLICSDASSPLVLTGLSVSTTYYFRVYVTTNPNVGNANKFNYDMCVFYPTPLAGDECATAPILVSNTGCINTSATLVGATASSGIPAGCAAAGTHYDLWFQFVAVKSSETITFKKKSPSNITNSELQLFSGTCGTLTSLQCGTTSIAATGLTPTATYYVRVSQVGGSALTTRGDFDICVTHTSPPPATIDYSKSYVNITKGTVGGTVDPGDTLEVRATFVVRTGSGIADSLAFFDTLYATEGLSLVPGSLALRTNEGKLYKSFTDNYDTDAGWKLESANNAADTVIQINFGSNASAVRRGSLTNTSRPSVFNNTCIIMATYRVVVTAAYNNLINMGGGSLTLLNGGNYSDLNFAPTNVMVYASPGLCPNAVSPTNALGAESNGTFGSGTTQNRTASPFTTYSYMQFNPAGPNDYFYGIANNTSTTGTIINNWAKPNSNRVHNVWDISGDHTSAADPLVGNSPTAIGSNGGYMLVVNSAYKADTAFTYTVTNLCPNTYYEISAWFKNICYKCGCDSTGVGTSGASYIPTALGDSSGVRPNIAFDVNGADYYTTGDLLYLGLSGGQTGSDAANQWVKKGFTYITGSAETSFTLTLRNNAPGGGGNDWALDDIAIATCSPNMSYSPSLAPNVCEGSQLTINDTIRSYFDNYTHYMWQKSVNNGAAWTDVTAPTSVIHGPPVNGEYEFVTSYTIPPANTTATDSGTLYRVLVATASANLGTTSCQVTDAISIINLAVVNCTVLGTELLSFNGKLADNNAHLSWSTSHEDSPLTFIVERSNDGRNFSVAGEIAGHNNGNTINHYSFTDPLPVNDKIWYRVILKTPANKKKHSSIIQLKNNLTDFDLTNIINPFSNSLAFNITIAGSSAVLIELIDMAGKTVLSGKQMVYAGTNSINLNNTQALSSGIYTLRVATKDRFIIRRVVKKN